MRQKKINIVILTILYFLFFQVYPVVHFHYHDAHGIELSVHPVDHCINEESHDHDHDHQHDHHQGDTNAESNGTHEHGHSLEDHVQIPSAHLPLLIKKVRLPSSDEIETFENSIRPIIVVINVNSTREPQFNPPQAPIFTFHGRSPPKF